MPAATQGGDAWPSRARRPSRTSAGGKVENLDPLLRQAAGGEQLDSTSPLTMTRLLDDPPNISNTRTPPCVTSPGGATDVLEEFDLSPQADRLAIARPVLPRLGLERGDGLPE